MTDRDVIEKAQPMFGDNSITTFRARSHQWLDQYGIEARGQKAFDIMGVVYPHLGSRRRAQIDRILLGVDIDRWDKTRWNTPTAAAA